LAAVSKLMGHSTITMTADTYYQYMVGEKERAVSLFMLTMILEVVTTSAPPQVGQLLQVMKDAMSREELQAILRLQDRKSFREYSLKLALADGLIEMTSPDKPNSRLQRYRLPDKGRQSLQSCDEG